jgi:hypothetical protein
LNASEESGIIIPIPEAEGMVGPYRWKYDSVARLGIPAHITLIYPFFPPSLITNDIRKHLADLFSNYPIFEFSLTSIGRFPNTVYLTPSPKDKIVDLVRMIATAFPQYPPYGGQFPEINPHLTVAQSDDALLLEQVDREIRPLAAQGLPITKRVTEATLFELHNGLWSKTGTFALKPN